MNLITRSKTLLEAYLHRDEFSKNQRMNKTVSLVKYQILFGKEPNKGNFPITCDYESTRNFFLSGIDSAPSGSDTILIGDSLSDFTRNQLSCVRPELNFAKAGQGSSYYIKIAQDIEPALTKLTIKNVILECFGNEFLGYFHIDAIKAHVDIAFSVIRKLFPQAKIILSGLPPVYDLYTNIHKLEFHQYLLDLVLNDENSVLVLLQKKFAGAFGIFPRIEYSQDGVHLAGQAIIEYDQLLNEAKSTRLKIIGV